MKYCLQDGDTFTGSEIRKRLGCGSVISTQVCNLYFSHPSNFWYTLKVHTSTSRDEHRQHIYCLNFSLTTVLNPFIFNFMPRPSLFLLQLFLSHSSLIFLWWMYLMNDIHKNKKCVLGVSVKACFSCLSCLFKNVAQPLKVHLCKNRNDRNHKPGSHFKILKTSKCLTGFNLRVWFKHRIYQSYLRADKKVSHPTSSR